MAATKRAAWKAVFIEVLERTGNVVFACKQAHITRSVAYAARSRSEKFATEWDEAIEIAVAQLEEEARRRAAEGVQEPVFFQGSVSGYVTRYSDSLLMFLLKAHAPEKYRERSQVEHAGKVDVRTLSDDELRAIVDAGRRG